jgi:hypothetical protein
MVKLPAVAVAVKVSDALAMVVVGTTGMNVKDAEVEAVDETTDSDATPDDDAEAGTETESVLEGAGMDSVVMVLVTVGRPG